MKSTSIAQKENILSLLDSGHTSYQISSQTGVSTATISRIRSKHRPTLEKAVGGHPSKLSPTNKQYATYLITSQKAENAVQIANTLQPIINNTLSAQTVHRCLKEAGMKPVVVQKRPRLLPCHRRERLDFAIAHKDWTMEDWKRVVWSDETKINRLGSDGRKWGWKQGSGPLPERLISGTLKFGGGSLMMWGCMLWDGVGNACRIDVRMTGQLYTEILEDDFLGSLELCDKDASDVIFQQDNDPKHTSKVAKEWFQTNDIEVLSWPAQSPDLNPIEHLWWHLKKQLGKYDTPPGGMVELWERIEREWHNIKPEVCQNLIESMPRRVAAVIKAKGGYTKY
jgi:hypothetical protein